MPDWNDDDQKRTTWLLAGLLLGVFAIAVMLQSGDTLVSNLADIAPAAGDYRR